MLVSGRVHCLSLWIGNPFCPSFSRKPREQKCQRDSGVEPTTLTHCPKTVSAFTLKALPQSLHGVMPDMQGTGSEAVAGIREMMRIWILLRRTHLSFRFSIWNGPLMNNPLMSSFHYDKHSGVSLLGGWKCVVETTGSTCCRMHPHTTNDPWNKERLREIVGERIWKSKKTWFKPASRQARSTCTARPAMQTGRHGFPSKAMRQRPPHFTWQFFQCIHPNTNSNEP